MDVIPAIDLRDGKVVRLIQGQYDKQITYRDDPAEQARQFHADGARWLHIVDLDGAKAGRPVNTASIEAIVCLGLLKVEVGGGLRDEASIAQLLDMGVTRVIIGTKAVSDFDWFSRMAEKFAGRIVLGLDARGSMVATHGWLEDSQQTVLEFAARADELPLAAIIYTDIAKDGMLTGPNLERTQALAEAVKTPVVASGGVKEADDIRRLHPIGVAGVIVGRSLYEGTLTLPDAIAAAK
ncbi:MAG: 1-(5-phosphoribosyl)-5-[(5-phosphoribosylamino)methylideneamino]imidazole-4-carboxamide isomerase [Sedimentisphaerales bacterium]|jgi:phosphoribosylformimino-5-aminoimidazole carboxamide ribotide isomerase|nr:1-(5-phosphoribosyl)-5-[(5-phosphoribosylamino)methylideneamino]imidazole-4-carboxamide isomerase [Sedimentisphaerales bacterium]NLT77206.1 1-(5-phosphoribosyl)-5-[(5-phosphoribosylamino)methylideneamino]imidazole-4-carboxamide isomerase [Planctomycetota bacterium]